MGVILVKLSARNRLKGTVESVEVGPIMSNIKIKIEEPGIVTAIITRDAVNALDIKEGDIVTAIVKSTEVMVAKE
jgi:molybdopterin-binding protein